MVNRNTYPWVCLCPLVVLVYKVSVSDLLTHSSAIVAIVFVGFSFVRHILELVEVILNETKPAFSSVTLVLLFAAIVITL